MFVGYSIAGSSYRQCFGGLHLFDWVARIVLMIDGENFANAIVDICRKWWDDHILAKLR